MFRYYNCNPSKKETSDCVIRAIATAEGKTWEEVFEILTDLARQRYTVLNDSEVYSDYLDSKYEKKPVMYPLKNGKKKRYTVKDVSKWGGTYVVRIANHLTVVKDKTIFDIWDCSDKSSYKIWVIK